jgi:hypothetical protein
MGRKSKLTEDQWAELFRRVAEGESRRKLADEYGLKESSIRQREAKTGKTAEVQQVAKMMVETEAAYKSLPISAQINAQKLADKLRSISDSLASAADLGAKTAHRLQALANSEVAKVDDANPLASVESLRNVGILTKLGNDSASIALNLLSANKETVKELNLPKPEDEPQVPLRPQISRDEWLKTHGLA